MTDSDALLLWVLVPSPSFRHHRTTGGQVDALGGTRGASLGVYPNLWILERGFLRRPQVSAESSSWSVCSSSRPTVFSGLFVHSSFYFDPCHLPGGRALSSDSSDFVGGRHHRPLPLSGAGFISSDLSASSSCTSCGDDVFDDVVFYIADTLRCWRR